MNKEFTGKSLLTSFCAESSEKNFNGLPGNKGHSNTAGGKSGAAYQRDWYFNQRKCCHDDAHLAAQLTGFQTSRMWSISWLSSSYIEIQGKECTRNAGIQLWKNITNLLSVQATMGHAATSNNKIHINESLTGYHKQLFGRINDFKRKNNTYGLQMERSCWRLMILQKPNLLLHLKNLKTTSNR